MSTFIIHAGQYSLSSKTSSFLPWACCHETLPTFSSSSLDAPFFFLLRRILLPPEAKKFYFFILFHSIYQQQLLQLSLFLSFFLFILFSFPYFVTSTSQQAKVHKNFFSCSFRTFKIGSLSRWNVSSSQRNATNGQRPSSSSSLSSRAHLGVVQRIIIQLYQKTRRSFVSTLVFFLTSTHAKDLVNNLNKKKKIDKIYPHFLCFFHSKNWDKFT